MSRHVIIDRDLRKRPSVACPAPRTPGDLVHEEDAAGTSVPSILAKYSGNLADLVRWHPKPIPFDCDTMPGTLEEANELLRRQDELLDQLPNPNNLTREQLAAAIKSGDYSVFNTNPNQEQPNEEVSNQPPEE